MSGNFFHDSQLPEFEPASHLFDSDATCDFSDVPKTEFQDLGRTEAPSHDSQLPESESASPLFESDATCDFSEVPETEFQDLGRTEASGGDGLHSKADPAAVMAEETGMESPLTPAMEKMMRILFLLMLCGIVLFAAASIDGNDWCVAVL